MSLSQDEINAMLTGTASADGAAEGDIALQPAAETEENNPDEQGTGLEDAPEGSGESFPEPIKEELTPDEIDVLGEVGNICMGAVATTMYTLLDRRVSITTPRVSVHTSREVLRSYQIPFVVVKVEYVEGIRGNNLLVLRVEDAALITDQLMGGDGTIEEPIELSEMHLSAISEIMNQMMGASATALAKLLHTSVNISPPQSMNVGLDSDVSEMLDNSEIVIKISFDMEIEGLLKSELLQIIPYSLGLELAEKFMENGMEAPSANIEKVEIPRGKPLLSKPPQEAQRSVPLTQEAPQAMPQETPQYAPPPQAAQMQGMAEPAYQHAYAMQHQQPAPKPGHLIDVHPMHYQSFDAAPEQGARQKSIDMIYDIPLQVSVELGKTKKDISEILAFGTGTIVVLDKIAGDPVEIVVNGKLIARGEVVVIEENYGVRITEILNN